MNRSGFAFHVKQVFTPRPMLDQTRNRVFPVLALGTLAGLACTAFVVWWAMFIMFPLYLLTAWIVFFTYGVRVPRR